MVGEGVEVKFTYVEYTWIWRWYSSGDRGRCVCRCGGEKWISMAEKMWWKYLRGICGVGRCAVVVGYRCE